SINKMGYISIYRKWRPQNFSEIVGQEDIVKTLKNALKTGRLSHAYLFCGPRGTGKTTTARIFAKAINCENKGTDKNNVEPCNTCESCISITNGSNVDIIEFDAASHRSVKDADDLTTRVSYLPSILKKKIYIIDEVHMLSTDAFNALLKTIEEPPEHVIFILATTEPNKVIPTILSRCQRFNFKPIKSDSMTGKLKTIASAENIDINDAALNLIAKYSGGSQRDANVILEKLASIDDKKIKVEDVASLLGAIDFEILFELTNILIERNVSDALFFEHRLKESYQNLRIFVEEFVNHLQQLFIIKNYESSFEILNINADYKEKYLDQANLISDSLLQFCIELFSSLYKEIRISEGSEILFRAALISAVANNASNTENAEKLQISNLQNKIEGFDKELENVNTTLLGIQANIDNVLNIINNKTGISENIQAKKPQVLSEKEKTAEKIENIEIKDSLEKQNSTMTSIKTGTDISKDKVRKPSDETETSSGSDFTDEVKAGWDRICSAIKSKERGIPLCAMFIEARKIKINKTSIFFYLPNNSQFHKENLNKAENTKKIEAAIKEVTGKDFTASFFFENEGVDFVNLKSPGENVKKPVLDAASEKGSSKEKPGQNTDLIKEQLSNQYSKVREKSEKMNNSHEEEDAAGSKNEEYDYFAKKFDIKEKKNGD
ncbi:MAG TPA: DNA polymerase III subunit gamma/tau, partial [Candidatus Humimicrobiaceae bacterium]